MKKLMLLIMTFTLFQCTETIQKTDIELPDKEGFISISETIELHYKILGEGGDTIIILHGGPGFPSSYLIPDLKPLAIHHTLIFYDQRGAGKSTPINDTLLLDASYFVSDLEKIRQYFSLTRLSLLGHSWGGLLAGLYAAEYPQNVKKMALIGSCPPAKKFHWDQFYSNFRNKFNEQTIKDLEILYDTLQSTQNNKTKPCWDYWSILITGYYSNPDMARLMWGDVCNCPVETIWGNNPDRSYTQVSLGDWDLTEQMKKWNFPVLIIHGEDDPMPTECAVAWQQHLPDAQISLYKNTGHFPQVESPELFFQQTTDFFKGQWPVDTALRPFEIDEELVYVPWSYYKAITEINYRNHRFARCIAEKNTASLIKFYAPDATLMVPTVAPFKGHSSIMAFWESSIDKGLRRLSRQTIHLEGNKKQLLEEGKYVLYGQDNEILDVGKYHVVWEHIKDKWVISKDIVSTNMKKPSKIYDWEDQYIE